MIPKNSRSSQLVVSLVIALALVVLGFFLTRSGQAESKAPEAKTDPKVVTVSADGKKVADIETASAEMSPIQNEIKTTGQLSFPADQTVKIAPKLTGKIRTVLVKVGDRVSMGQPIAIMESVDAANAETTAMQNDNKVRQARLTLDRYERLQALGTPDVTAAQASLDQAQEGVVLAKRVLDLATYQDKIGGFTEKPLEDARNAVVSATSALSQARSDYSLAQKDLDRKNKLVAIGVAAQTDLEVSQDTFEKAQANLQQNDESVKLARQAVAREEKAFNSRLYADQQLQQASSAYHQAILQRNAAATSLRMAKAQIQRDLDQARSDQKAAQFDAENAHRALSLLGNPSAGGSVTITSPVSGVVTERDVADGQIVDQSQMAPWQLMVISNTDTVWVDADVYEKDIAQVKVGAPIEIQVSAMPGKTFEGKVLKIAPTVDKTSRSVKVRAQISNRSGALRDGEYADVTLPLGSPHQALVVPMSAVSHEGDNDFVYLDEGDKYRKQQIRLGARQGNRTEVASGLRPGDKIAAKGAIFLGGQVSDD